MIDYTLFGVSILIHVLVFCLLNFTFSGIVFCDKNCIDNNGDDADHNFDVDGFILNNFSMALNIFGVLTGDNGLFFTI